MSFFFFQLILLFTFSQSDTTSTYEKTISIIAFTDCYFLYDFNRSAPDLKRQSFLYNYNRHGALKMNFGVIKGSYQTENFYTNIGLHAGTYVDDNYASEHFILRNFSELNAGIFPFENKKTSIDAGIFPSYIGFESVMSDEQLTLSRSLLAENSPYYLSGLCIRHKTSPFLQYEFFALTGWQKILPEKGKKYPDVGARFFYNHHQNLQANLGIFWEWSSNGILGGKKFLNTYIIFNVQKFRFVGGIDFGVLNHPVQRKTYAWHAASLICQYALTKKFKSALRAEYYADKDNQIILHPQSGSFLASGLSLNADYALNRALIRFEARYLQSPEKIFFKAKGWNDHHFTLGFSFVYRFSLELYR
ncbi:MAG: porin [Bacteroidia bacterium]|nr:porin [Bacteroidia bacterium]